MTNDQGAENFVRAARNETWLLSFRVMTLALCSAATILGFFAVTMLNDIRGGIVDVRRDLSALDRRYAEDRVLTADRMGKVEGQVGELKGSVETHRRRLDDGDNDRRAMWQRLFEMGRSRPNPNHPKPD